MGRQTALSIAETELSLEDQITWHLTGNFFPPIPKSMVAPCVRAIELANEAIADGVEYLTDIKEEIDLPEGVLWRGKNSAPVDAMITGHRLDTWLDHVVSCDCSTCLPDVDDEE